MVITKIDPFSCGKIALVVYGGIGLIAGLIFAMLSLVGAGVAGDEGGAMLGAVFGLGAVIFLPLFYGVIGFVAGIIGSLIYNVAAGIVGGLQIETE